MRIPIIIVVLIVLLLGCLKPKNTENRHQILTICNRSDSDIYFYQGHKNGDLRYSNPMPVGEWYFIRANDCKKDYDDEFEYIIEQSDSNRLTYYFFDSEVLQTVPWDTVYHRRMILGVRHYTKPMLDSLDWQVEFP